MTAGTTNSFPTAPCCEHRRPERSIEPCPAGSPCYPALRRHRRAGSRNGLAATTLVSKRPDSHAFATATGFTGRSTRRTADSSTLAGRRSATASTVTRCAICCFSSRAAPAPARSAPGSTIRWNPKSYRRIGDLLPNRRRHRTIHRSDQQSTWGSGRAVASGSVCGRDDRSRCRLRMTTRTAQRACGRVEVTVEGEPLLVYVCHCDFCQRRSANVFIASAQFPEKQVVSITGETRCYNGLGIDGVGAVGMPGGINYRFCAVCGSSMYMDAIFRTPASASSPSRSAASSMRYSRRRQRNSSRITRGCRRSQALSRSTTPWMARSPSSRGYRVVERTGDQQSTSTYTVFAVTVVTMLLPAPGAPESTREKV
jgi:hypothetical protein